MEEKWPDRWSFKDSKGQMDVPRLDLHLMRMLGQSGLTHRVFFQKMADHYKFPDGPFRDADTLLKVMTETSLTLIEPRLFCAVLEANSTAMQDATYARLVRFLPRLGRP